MLGRRFQKRGGYAFSCFRSPLKSAILGLSTIIYGRFLLFISSQPLVVRFVLFPWQSGFNRVDWQCQRLGSEWYPSFSNGCLRLLLTNSCWFPWRSFRFFNYSQITNAMFERSCCSSDWFRITSWQVLGREPHIRRNTVLQATVLGDEGWRSGSLSIFWCSIGSFDLCKRVRKRLISNI